MANKTLGGGGFHHVAIAARDFDRSIRSYTEVLGFAPARSWGGKNGRAAMLDTGDGNYLEVFERPAHDAPSQGAVLHFALRTSDASAAIERAHIAGAEITVEPKDIEIASTPAYPVRIAFFKGPGGEIVELFQER